MMVVIFYNTAIYRLASNAIFSFLLKKLLGYIHCIGGFIVTVPNRVILYLG
jgi:hypothetical protein